MMSANISISFPYLEIFVKPNFGKNTLLAEALRNHMWNIHWQSFTQTAVHSPFPGNGTVNQGPKMSDFCFKIIG